MKQTLTWRSKLSFGLGGFGKDLVYAIVSTYLMKYMTDVRLVDPMIVAVLFTAHLRTCLLWLQPVINKFCAITQGVASGIL